MALSQIVAGEFVLRQKLGQGAFGDVFSAARQLGGREMYAVKVEELAYDEDGQLEPSQLLAEAKFYHALAGVAGIPRVYQSSREGGFNLLVMDLLGDSLETLFQRCGQQFSLRTVLMLADQLLDRLEDIHARGIVHRDVKPSNFVVGLGPVAGGRVYAIDFGLSKWYRDERTGRHIAFREGQGLTGTARYASLNSHVGSAQSRRDDLESLGYMLLYLLGGRLPWMGLRGESDASTRRRIMEVKLTTPLDELCRGHPPEFGTFLGYCRGLRFEEEPDYDYCRKLFADAFRRRGYKRDSQFDWVAPMELKQSMPLARACRRLVEPDLGRDSVFVF